MHVCLGILVNVTFKLKSLKCNNVISFTIYLIMFQIRYLLPSNVTFMWLSTVLRIQEISVVISVQRQIILIELYFLLVAYKNAGVLHQIRL